jgi:hypothetical protein
MTVGVDDSRGHVRTVPGCTAEGSRRGAAAREMLVIHARTGQDARPMKPSMELTNRERAMLDFERGWWQLPGRKNIEIRARFATSTSSYYRALNSLVERPEAIDYDPLTVRRLRKRREQARRERIEGRHADPGSR